MSKIDTARQMLADAEARQADAAEAIEGAADDIATEELEALEAEFDVATDEVARSKAKVERFERTAEARKNAPNFPAAKGSLRTERTYTPQADFSFFADMYAARNGGDAEARERLARHEAEARDVVSSEVIGVIFPVYLPELMADYKVAGRPFANVVPKLPLPPYGETFKWPRVTQPAAVAVQAAEEDAVNEQDVTIDNDDSDLVTIAGQVDVSRQSLERSYPGLDVIIMRDLIRSYNQKLDAQLISGSGSNGQHIGLHNVSSPNTVSFTGSTAAALLTSVYDAIQKVESNHFDRASAIVMHPRRAAWLAAGRDDSAPLFQQGGLVLTQGQQDQGFVGVFAGLPVITDPNVPTNLGAATNQDEVYVMRLEDMALMEGDFRTMTFEDVLSGTLQVRIQGYAYSAAALHRYPKALTVLSGSGLTTPSF